MSASEKYVDPEVHRYEGGFNDSSDLSSVYFVMHVLGQGGFGKVYQCMRRDDEKLVAVKLISSKDAWMGNREVNILERLGHLGYDQNNLVRFNGHHVHNGDILMEFEKLDMTINDFISKFKPLRLSEIQAVTRQMLVALDALKHISLIHVDIKPNNIMLIDHQLQPMKVKLIDFGLAIPVSNIQHGSKIQIPHYRAPEVMLGLGLNEAVDMWSLGCVLAYMYTGTNLYTPIICEHDLMAEIVQMVGQPGNHLLECGLYTNEYFFKDGDAWKMKTTCCCWKSYVNDTTETTHHTGKFSSLDQIALTRPHIAECEDTQAFLSLLKRMLQLDPEKRITPGEALEHPFITTRHFPSDSHGNPQKPSTSATEPDCPMKDRDAKLSQSLNHYTTGASCSLSAYEDTDTLIDEEFKCYESPGAPANRHNRSHSDPMDETSSGPAAVGHARFGQGRTTRRCVRRIRNFFSKRLNNRRS